MACYQIWIMKREGPEVTQATQNRRMWQYPWHYRESFAVAAGLLFTGYILQAVSRSYVRPIGRPANYIIAIIFIAMLLLLHISQKRHGWVKWLRSVPASISAIVLLLTQAVIMGTVPQRGFSGVADPGLLGFNNVTSSWPFLFSLVFFLTTLGMATLNKMSPWKGKNLAFILNHLGLWIALTAGILGTGDLKRYTMDLYKGQPEWRAKDDQNRVTEMPFAFELKNFEMETFAPKLAFANISNNKIESSGINALRMIQKGDNYHHRYYRIEILDYINDGKFTGEKFVPVNEEGSAPAALIRVTGNGIDTSGWISCGSFATSFAVLQLNNEDLVMMIQPEAKKFSSVTEVYTKNQQHYKTTIEVNKPYEFDGWKVYQLSYDERFGKWSKLSVIELVRDPWLPVVYTGIFMMLAGAIHLIIRGRRE